MSSSRPEDVQAAFCAVLVDEWARSGITHAVVAPGSRSTPMVLALDRDDRISVELVLDERSAGFMALGMGLGSGRPAVVVTTSGTASVELHPAVVEAHQSGVPLLAVTTDRPPELHRVGAPQTVEQETLFGAAVVWSASPGVADLEASGTWRSLASRCAFEARRGPVHLNLAFREPLIGDPSAIAVPTGRAGEVPWHVPADAVRGRTDLSAVGFLRSYAGRRGLIVAGGMSNAPDREVLGAALLLGWPVLADPRSSLRIPHPAVVAAADSLLRLEGLAEQRPEIVVRIGSIWASKVLAQWLAALPPEVPQVMITDDGRWADPDHTASLVTSMETLISSVPTDLASDRSWFALWASAESVAQRTLTDELTDLSEPAVARAVVTGVPDGTQVFVSSSMPVRDVEWFAPPRDDVRVLANRGANGIDGIVSTAIGVAVASTKPTVALTGDLAFLYDASALLWATTRDLALTVVVVDNDGGGIFSFLSQAQQLDATQFEARWGTPHGIDPMRVAEAYGIQTFTVSDRPALDTLLARAGDPGMRVAVVKSDRAANVASHARVNRAVTDAIAQSLALNDQDPDQILRAASRPSPPAQAT